MEIQLILAACIVNFGLSSTIQPHNQIADQLQNLFGSITKNDAKQSDIYHEILMQEVAKEQQAFHTMKEELQIARNGNSYKWKNFHKKTHIRATKRDINELNRDDVTPFPFPNRSTQKDEEEWIETYGTHKNDSGKWPLSEYLKDNLDELNLFCIKAHKQLNQTILKAVNAHVSFWLITFENRSIEPIWADMIQYAEERPRIETEVFSYLYMIKGNRPDCVFYIKEYMQHEDKLTEMVFAEHVCGIQGFETFKIDKKKKKQKIKQKKENDLDYF